MPSKILKCIESFVDCNVIYMNDYLSHSIFPSGNGFIYRVGAIPLDRKTGVICGDINNCIYKVGIRNLEYISMSYPAGLGKTIGNPKAKVPVNKQALKIEMGEVEGWMDEETDLEAPFNYKDIDNIKEDCCGVIYAVVKVKTLINIRG